MAIVVLVAVLAGAWATGLPPFSPGPNNCALSLEKSLTLPNAIGRIDHMAYDSGRGLLYVAALGNNSLDVLNVTSGSLLKSLGGFSEPQGVLLVPATGSLYVSNGGTGVVNILDETTLRSVANLSLGSDADNMRYDQASGFVYVGYGEGGIAVIDARNNSIVGRIPLSGHPESFQVDDSSRLLYVNVPTSGYVAVVNLTQRSVIQRWPLGNSSGNFPMALDAANGRLFVGTRSPPSIIVLYKATGTSLASVSIPQDPDDAYFDQANGCLYVSSGSGYVTAISRGSGSSYSIAGQYSTSAGARTSLLDAASGLFFVASPSSGSTAAQILVFRDR